MSKSNVITNFIIRIGMVGSFISFGLLISAILLTPSILFARSKLFQICNEMNFPVLVARIDCQSELIFCSSKGWIRLKPHNCTTFQTSDFEYIDIYARSVDGKWTWGEDEDPMNYVEVCVGNSTSNFNVTWEQVGLPRSPKDECPDGTFPVDPITVFFEEGIYLSENNAATKGEQRENVLKEDFPPTLKKFKNQIITLDRLITEVEEFLEKEGSYISDLRPLLEGILNMPLDQINIDQLPENVPTWFKTYLKQAQKKITDARASIEKDTISLNEEIHSLKAEAHKVFVEENLQPEDINLENLGLEELDEISFAPPEDPQFDQEDNPYKEYADDIIHRLISLREEDNRIGFVEVVYSWLENQEAFRPLIERRAGLIEGEWEAYEKNQARILQVVRQYMDEHLYFLDRNIPSSVKDSIQYSISKHAPEIAKRLKAALNNSKGDNSERHKRTLENLVEIGEGYEVIADIGDPDVKDLWDQITLGVTEHIQNGLSTTLNIADCLAKTAASGPYADYYELRYGRDYCTDKPNTTFDQVVAATNLTLTACGTSIFGPIGGFIGDKIGKVIKSLKLVFSRIFKKFTVAATKVRKRVDVVFDILGLTRKFDIPANEIKEFAKSVSKSGMYAAGRKVGTNPTSLLKNGKIDGNDLAEIIPKGKPNIFKSRDGRFSKGFKYKWDYNGTKYLVQGHSADLTAPVGSNSASGWTVRIKVGNKFLGNDGQLYRVRSKNSPNSNKTHIPFKPIIE